MLNDLRNGTAFSFTAGAISRYDVPKTQKLNVTGNDP